MRCLLLLAMACSTPQRDAPALGPNGSGHPPPIDAPSAKPADAPDVAHQTIPWKMLRDKWDVYKHEAAACDWNLTPNHQVGENCGVSPTLIPVHITRFLAHGNNMLVEVDIGTDDMVDKTWKGVVLDDHDQVMHEPAPLFGPLDRRMVKFDAPVTQDSLAGKRHAVLINPMKYRLVKDLSTINFP